MISVSFSSLWTSALLFPVSCQGCLIVDFCPSVMDESEGVAPSGYDLLGSMVDCLCRVGASVEDRSATRSRLENLVVLEIVEALVKGSKSSGNEQQVLRARLTTLRVAELRALAKCLDVRLTGAGKKDEIVDRSVLAMSSIDAILMPGTCSEETVRLTYIAEDVKKVLSSLPPFKSVTEWSKEFRSVLKTLHFMNVLTYLVYGRDKTFDMESMRAFRSLKGFIFLLMDL